MGNKKGYSKFKNKLSKILIIKILIYLYWTNQIINFMNTKATFLISIFPLFCSGQTIANRSISDIINYDIKKKSIEDIDGTPYISDTFSISKINHITNSVETRYNIYTDEIEFKLNNNIYILPKDESLYNTIAQSDGTIIKLIHGSYYFVLSKFPKLNLLSKEKISIDKNETLLKNGYNKEEIPSYIREKTTYYILYNDKLIRLDKNFDILKTNLDKKEIGKLIKKTLTSC